MVEVEYKIFFNDQSATQEQLDRIEDITVEQEIDTGWEARLTLPVCTDGQGNWRGETEDFMEPDTRVRIEVRNRTDDFVPLIEGLVVENDFDRSAEPGRSSITLMIRDVTVNLEQEEVVSSFDDLLDHQIAEQVFGEFGDIITSTDVEPTQASDSTLQAEISRRSTAIHLLRHLAERNGKHVYILPGDNPGESVGCFKSCPTELSDLTPLILLGPDRNMESFRTQSDSRRASTVQASTLSLDDREITTSTSRYGDLDFLGDEYAEDETRSTRSTHLLRPRYGDTVDLDTAVQAEAEALSYAFQATGRVIPFCYPGVLLPYQLVSIGGVGARQSGDYMITKVTHNLTRSQYSQSFTVWRNAESVEFGEDSQDVPGDIF